MKIMKFSHIISLLAITCKEVFGNAIDSKQSVAKKCRVSPHRSVEYRCRSADAQYFRPCEEYEGNGTTVLLRCKTHYYTPTVIPRMHCIDGSWDRVSRCYAECGTIASALILGHHLATVTPGMIPWHTAVYNKKMQPYEQICSGVLVTDNIVLSAAVCFWDDENQEQLASSDYVVVVGKIHRNWNVLERKSQQSDIKGVFIPDRFESSFLNYHLNIAVIVLAKKLRLNAFIMPACLDFQVLKEVYEKDLGKGMMGGWDHDSDISTEMSDVLQEWNQFTYMNLWKCKEVYKDFSDYITTDKFCAVRNDSKRCHQESGAGLVFPEVDLRGHTRYYLRGISSIIPKLCESNENFSVFTKIEYHEDFIMSYIHF